jgi:hypothetical protein
MEATGGEAKFPRQSFFVGFVYGDFAWLKFGGAYNPFNYARIYHRTGWR